MTYIRGLFSSDFVPHGFCLRWQPDVVWLHVISDSLIFLAYVSIPFLLASVARKRKDFSFHWMLIAFGTFILACSLTHAMSILTLWYPLYRLEGIIKAVTAIASVTTAICLAHLLPVILKMPSPANLREANAALDAANRAKSEFLAAMSHEIRTPMNAILGMSDMLAESQLDAAQMQYVEVFRRAGSNLLVLINDILDFSKIEAGYLELEQVDFDLEDVVDQALDLTGVKARAKGLKLFSHLAPGLATSLIGDPARLRQILVNLLGNAVKFTESGEILLTVQNHSSGNPGEIAFSISDTGIGIPAEKLESVFQSFTQAEPSTARNYGGTGLGLQISRRLIEQMGGRVTVTSRVGKGSTFRFNAQFVPGAPRQPKTAVEVSDLQGRRILVIDNNATNRFILSETLHSWGMESEEFAEPAAALASFSAAAAANRPFSLLLVDAQMPVMDGFETTALIKQIAPELPVIMFSSDARPGDILRRRDAGLAGHALKPVKRSELLRLICQAMKLAKPEGNPVAESEVRKETPPVKPLSILVAEDSADNRLLIQFYLRGSEHQLTFAEDGKAAVEQFNARRFDLIFMDVQMPVMDGLAATRAIRAIERERDWPSIPIIALTANARSQDVAISHAAGCNGHLSKPIAKQTLLKAIEDLHAMRAGGPPAKLEDHGDIDIPPGLEECARTYIKNQGEGFLSLQGLLHNQDFQQLQMRAHDMKGTGESYGFPEITRIGASLETAAKERDVEAIARQLYCLSASLQRACAYFDSPA